MYPLLCSSTVVCSGPIIYATKVWTQSVVASLKYLLFCNLSLNFCVQYTGVDLLHTCIFIAHHVNKNCGKHMHWSVIVSLDPFLVNRIEVYEKS